MSIASRLLVKLADRRWKTSLATGLAVALIWHLLLEKILQGTADTPLAMPGLAASPLLLACGVFLLSALSFHLLRPVATENLSPTAEKDLQNPRLHLKVQLLIGLYDENIFRHSDLPLYCLPEVLLRTACTDVKRLATEQADALLAAQRFHQTALHHRQCDTPEMQHTLILLKNTLSDIRAQGEASGVYFFQGVLETETEEGIERLIPWAFTLSPEQGEQQNSDLMNTKTLQSLETEVMVHLQEGFDGSLDPRFSLPLMIANWLK